MARIISLVGIFALLLIGWACPPPSSTLTITTSNLPAADVGMDYSQQLMATGGVPPYTWSLVKGPLPGNLTLSTQGVIAGNVLLTACGVGVCDYPFTVQVTDSSGNTAQMQGTSRTVGRFMPSE